jgi:hypothetical protein
MDKRTADTDVSLLLLLQVAVCCSKEGKLKVVACDSRWVMGARLADDCHSYNVVLQRGGAGNTVVLHVVRTIRSGEELQLWFSEHMLVLLAVPFLTPLNIQGKVERNVSLSPTMFQIPSIQTEDGERF